MKDRILCIDHDEDQGALLGALLERLGYAVVAMTSPKAALDLMEQQPFDVVVTDIGMKEMDGLALCERSLEILPGVPVILVTGQASLEVAVGAIRAGAYDFLVKPLDAKLTSFSVARAVQHHRLQAEVHRLRDVLSTMAGDSRLIGDSAAMRRLRG